MALRIICLARKGLEKILGKALSSFGTFRKPGLRGYLVKDRFQRVEFLGLECALQGMAVHSRPLSSAWGGSALLLTWWCPYQLPSVRAVYAHTSESPSRESSLPHRRRGSEGLAYPGDTGRRGWKAKGMFLTSLQ